MAQALELQSPGPRFASRLALPDRDQRLSRRASRQAAPGPAAPDRRGERSGCADPAPGRPSVATAVSGPAAGGDRPGRGRAGCGGSREGDDRASVRRGDSAPAAETARGPDPARRARVVGQGHRLAARGERRGGEQRPATGKGNASGPPGRAANGLGAGLPAERGRARVVAALRRSPRAGRRRRARRAPAGGRAPDHASAPHLVRRTGGGHGRNATGLRSLLRRAPDCRRRRDMQPAAAHYLRTPGDSRYRALALDLLRLDGGHVAEITSFVSPELFPAFGLRPQLSER